MVLVVWTSVHIPPFEAPDAYFHYAVADHLADTGDFAEGSVNPWRQMAFHAPLYYVISAGMIAPLDRPDFPIAYPLNPHA
jgi:hypothetical protein